MKFKGSTRVLGHSPSIHISTWRFTKAFQTIWGGLSIEVQCCWESTETIRTVGELSEAHASWHLRPGTLCPEVVLTPWVHAWIVQCVLFCIWLFHSRPASGFSHAVARVAVGLL